MKAIIAAMLTCVVIFGLSAGATQFLLQQDPADAEMLDGGVADAMPDENSGTNASLDCCARTEGINCIDQTREISNAIA